MQLGLIFSRITPLLPQFAPAPGSVRIAAELHADVLQPFVPSYHKYYSVWIFDIFTLRAYANVQRQAQVPVCLTCCSRNN